MKNYIDTFPVDISTHPIFKKYTPSDWAMYFIEQYGQIDGGHHKQWVLDQVARCLKGVPVIVGEAKWEGGHSEYRISTSEELSFEYNNWVCHMKGDYDENGDVYEYDYDVGIAP